MIITDKIPTSRHSKAQIELKCDVCDSRYYRRFDVREISFDLCKKDLCKRCSRVGAAEKMRKAGRKMSEEQKKLLIEARRKKYPPLTRECKYCNKPFTVPYGKRNSLYCSRPCQWKRIDTNKSDIRTISKCQICETEFKHYGERRFCGRKCTTIFLKESRLGENNPNYIKRDKLDKSECPSCGIIFTHTRNSLHKGQKRFFCSLACSHLKGGGKNLKNKEQYIIDSNNYDRYVEYASNPYGSVWTEEFKNQIKLRDGRCCQLCGDSNKLEVHHIDYNKKNSTLENLITLCKKCHNITHHNRPFWTQVFIGLNSNSKIVKKGWGLEIHFANNDKYCLKYLIFFKGKKFSLHKHELKQELWFCAWGAFECLLKTKDFEDYFLFKTGDKIEIKPGVEHQLKALTNCIITEVSTPDFPEDSIRIERGD